MTGSAQPVSEATPSVPAETTDEAPFRQWQGLEERWVLDTSEDERVYLLEGRNGSRIRVSESAHKLLALRASGVTSEAIAEALAAQGQEVSGEEIEEKYQGLCARIEKIESEPPSINVGYLFRVPILRENLVVAIASRVKGFFRPRWVAIFLTVIFASLWGPIFLQPPTDFSPSGFWLGYALLLVSVLIHEFGHAGACAYYGARPSDIGATLYLIYPALYSDVSAAWRLSRMQRVVVDLGGMYFQFTVGAAYMAGYALTGWRPFWVGFLMILGSTVFSLNPIFRFDGYWVIADSLGVTNLGSQPSRVVRHAFRRLKGQAVDPLPWSPKVTITLAVYSVLTFLVFGFFFSMLGPRIWGMASSLPGQLRAYWQGEPGTSLGGVLMSTAMAALITFIAYRLVRSMVVQPVLGLIRRLRHKYGRRPALPSAAAGESNAPVTQGPGTDQVALHREPKEVPS